MGQRGYLVIAGINNHMVMLLGCCGRMIAEWALLEVEYAELSDDALVAAISVEVDAVRSQLYEAVCRIRLFLKENITL